MILENIIIRKYRKNNILKYLPTLDKMLYTNKETVCIDLLYGRK